MKPLIVFALSAILSFSLMAQDNTDVLRLCKDARQAAKADSFADADVAFGHPFAEFMSDPEIDLRRKQIGVACF